MAHRVAGCTVWTGTEAAQGREPLIHRAVPALMSLLLVGCEATVDLPSATPEATVTTSALTEQSTQPTPDATLTPSFGEGPQGPTVEAQVVAIVDGDTIRVEIDGTVYRLRYIGIDSPEVGLPHADEATAADRRLVGAATVFLETDVSNTDQFGRLLRYVWLAHGTGWLLVNRELVRLGDAVSKAYPPDTEYQSLFDTAQEEALAAAVGVWSATSAPIVPFVGTPKPAANCDPSYPTVCIPPPPPDLDCKDITYRRFKVLPPDPHHFDGNHDGIGCEG